MKPLSWSWTIVNCLVVKYRLVNHTAGAIFGLPLTVVTHGITWCEIVLVYASALWFQCLFWGSCFGGVEWSKKPESNPKTILKKLTWLMQDKILDLVWQYLRIAKLVSHEGLKSPCSRNISCCSVSLVVRPLGLLLTNRASALCEAFCMYVYTLVCRIVNGLRNN